ncbi:MAG: acyltransferase [Clostridia bacterium]|nr:acyltransferase [Clostridia bacterium]
MTLPERVYRLFSRKEPPYYLKYSILKLICKPIRKYITNVIAANCPFNTIRIFLYRCCGFKIGKKCFIGMRCYLDDLCYDYITIGNNVIISYGVFFACHGRNQKHLPITIKDNAYIGMRTSIISKNRDKEREGIIIGESAVIGACSLINMDIPDGATAVGSPCRIINEK